MDTSNCRCVETMVKLKIAKDGRKSDINPIYKEVISHLFLLAYSASCLKLIYIKHSLLLDAIVRVMQIFTAVYFITIAGFKWDVILRKNDVILRIALERATQI